MLSGAIRRFASSTNHGEVCPWFIRHDERVCARAIGGLATALCILLAFLFIPSADGRQESALEKTDASASVGPQAQQTDVPSADQEKPMPPTIEVESNLVLLDVLVTDDTGTVLSGLKRGNFRVLDNGKPQVITYFAPFVVDKGHARLRAITIGHRSQTEAEILSGIVAGESAILYPPNQLHDGIAVRTQ